MQQRPLGRSGLAVSRLALGTMTWGRDTDPDDAAAQLKVFLDAGGTLIDTADVYGDGDAESVIGSLLDHLVPRDELLIATKAGLRPGGAAAATAPAGHLLRTLDASLRRLGTDHVDLWQVHGYDPRHPAGGDPGRAGPRGDQRPGPLRRGVELLRLADRPGRRPGRPALPGPGPDRRRPDGVLAAGTRHRARGAARLRGAGHRACCPGRRWAAGCSPASTATAGRPTPGPRRRISSAFVAATWSRAAPASSRRSPPPPAGSACRRWRWRWPGSATGPGVVAPILGARTVGQLLGALQVEEMTLPAEIARALDDVSAVPVGYPERDG